MDSVRGVRIHCACGAIMKCKKLSASKLPFFFLLCCLCGVFTAPSVLQWILTCRYLAGHGALKNTMDSELRCRIASVYEAIMSRHNLAGHDPLKTHKGFWPPRQNPLCFAGRRDAVTATNQTQWILTRRAESIVFFDGS